MDVWGKPVQCSMCKQIYGLLFGWSLQNAWLVFSSHTCTNVRTHSESKATAIFWLLSFISFIFFTLNVLWHSLIWLVLVHWMLFYYTNKILYLYLTQRCTQKYIEDRTTSRRILPKLYQLILANVFLVFQSLTEVTMTFHSFRDNNSFF